MEAAQKAEVVGILLIITQAVLLLGEILNWFDMRWYVTLIPLWIFLFFMYKELQGTREAISATIVWGLIIWGIDSLLF